MEFITKLLIPIFIIVAIIVVAISYYNITTVILSNNTVELNDDMAFRQTPYVIQPHPTKIYPVTPQPTPTPLYYEALQNPNEPCTETYQKFQTNCLGRIKNESYCDYWLSESRKKCSFMQW